MPELIVVLDDDGLLSWQERALCAQTDPEAFFPEKGADPPARPRRSARRVTCGRSAWSTRWPTMNASASGVACPSVDAAS